MQMWPSGAPGAAAESNLLALGNVLAFFHAELRKMEVEREQSLAVVNHDAVAFEVECAREDHGAGIDCRNGSAGGRVEIQSLMRALDSSVEDALHSEDVRNRCRDRTLK